MNKKYLLIALVVAQLAVPSFMIASQENILKKGDLYNFKTAPVDPYDVLRGRYVALSFVERSLDYAGEELHSGQDIYLILENDGDGFARVVRIELEQPKGNNYIKTKALYAYRNKVNFNLPFNRYYMNEKKAKEAERLYRDATVNRIASGQGRQREAYAAVRVLKGKALIEELMLDGRPIESFFDQ